jgi:hypothetical protein
VDAPNPASTRPEQTDGPLGEAKLPPVLKDLASLDLAVAWGKVKITAEALVFVVSFHTAVHRRAT